MVRVEYGNDGKGTLRYGTRCAVYEYGPLSTAVASSPTTPPLDLLELSETIGAPITDARLWVEGDGSAPSTAVIKLRLSANGQNFVDSSVSSTGVTSAAPTLLDVRGVPFIRAEVTTGEASDSVRVFISLHAAQ